MSKSAKRIARIQHVTSESSSDVTHNFYSNRDETIIHFGTGAIQCDFLSDKVCLGNLCSDHQTILTATNMSENPFSYVKFDGIIGLSFSHLSVNPNANILESLYRQKKISEKVFAFYFNKEDNMKSLLTIGGIDQAKYKGDIVFSKVISKDYWEIKIDAIYYGTKKLSLCDKLICTAIIDTGTSMMAAPTSI